MCPRSGRLPAAGSAQWVCPARVCLAATVRELHALVWESSLLPGLCLGWASPEVPGGHSQEAHRGSPSHTLSRRSASWRV